MKGAQSKREKKFRVDEIPRSELIDATLQALRNLGGSATREEIYDAAARLMHLPAEVVDEPLSDEPRTKLWRRLHHARVFLKKVGVATNTSPGVWMLTPKGRALTDGEIAALLAQYRSTKRARGAEDDDDNDLEGEEAIGWQKRLLAILQSMPSASFERLCQRILREAGFSQVKVTGRKGDGGVDGYGILRMNSLISFPVIFQAKRWRGSVGSPVVRNFRGALVGRSEKGLIITTGRFSRRAREEATRAGTGAIDLIDGSDLCSLLKDLSIGVKVGKGKRVDIDQSVFSDDDVIDENSRNRKRL